MAGMKRLLDEDAIVERVAKRCRAALLLAPVVFVEKRKTMSDDDDESIMVAVKKRRNRQEEVSAAVPPTTDDYIRGFEEGHKQATDKIMDHLYPTIDEFTRNAVRELNQKYEEMYDDICRALGVASIVPVYVN